MAKRFDILTLFPDMCRSVVECSIIGRATKADKLQVNLHNIRDYATNKWHKVDDTPYGGGMGMLMQAEPIYLCYEAVCEQVEEKPYVIYMSPQGAPLNQKKAIELAQLERPLMLLCGHYEGVDQRVLDLIVDEEISIGDYVLTGGELAAMVVVDAVGRLCPGVLSNEECFTEESHYNGLLEYPHYTKPSVWRDMEVPEVLLNGHHAKITKWRREQSLKNTYTKRPDMLENVLLEKADKEYIKSLKQSQEND